MGKIITSNDYKGWPEGFVNKSTISMEYRFIDLGAFHIIIVERMNKNKKGVARVHPNVHWEITFRRT